MSIFDYYSLLQNTPDLTIKWNVVWFKTEGGIDIMVFDSPDGSGDTHEIRDCLCEHVKNVSVTWERDGRSGETSKLSGASAVFLRWWWSSW